ncbi:MAG: NAD(+) synthase [Acidimicrobiia bacterium]
MPVVDDLLARDALGFVRVAAVSPANRVADVAFNAEAICAEILSLADESVELAVFPELCLTGYSCGELFRQPSLFDAAFDGLATIAATTAATGVAAVIGLPFVHRGRCYNAAALVASGVVVGIVPKQHLPNRSEFYEDRWFVRATEDEPAAVRVGDAEVPFGTDLLFALPGRAGAVVAVEICEDLWAVEPPSGRLALAGANIIANPSASPELLGKAEYRTELVRQQSARSLAVYCYAGAGPGESTMDVVYGGHSLICENGTERGSTRRFEFATQRTITDVDVKRLEHERLNNSSFAADRGRETRMIPVPAAPAGAVDLTRPATELLWPVDRLPFVPDDLARRSHHCEEVFAIQSTGLAKRLLHTGSRHVVIGISGGLDSTLALLVTVQAFDAVGLDHSGIVAITMPGFGTSSRTRDNAHGLMAALGVTVREIPIAPAVRSHFADIDHDESQHDVTYENAQARERTQILMDVANQVGGLVVGTGDLSEAALGWMTFNGDHMSMYHVNAGVPKTLVRHLVTWAGDERFGGEVRELLHDVVDTPITPELLPLSAEGALEQKTEESVGPYELHDFFLYHCIRSGARPAKVFALARAAFDGVYADDVIVGWLEVFWRRFVSQQFKRSSMPDGPKVGSVALSPRGDWRMPSDASSAPWLAELTRLRKDLEV